MQWIKSSGNLVKSSESSENSKKHRLCDPLKLCHIKASSSFAVRGYKIVIWKESVFFIQKPLMSVPFCITGIIHHSEMLPYNDFAVRSSLYGKVRVNKISLQNQSFLIFIRNPSIFQKCTYYQFLFRSDFYPCRCHMTFILRLRSVYKELHADRETGC